MESVTAAGGIVYRQRRDRNVEIVLIYRRGVWDLPKGKIEEGESIEECARREVAEEIGLDDYPEIVKRLTKTYHEYHRDGLKYGKTTHWFAMRTNSMPLLSPQASEGIKEVAWTTLQEAQGKIGYENLRMVLDKFKTLL